MNFVQLFVPCSEQTREFVLAVVSQFDFDTFEDQPNGLLAFAPQALIDEDEVRQTLADYPEWVNGELEFSIVERQNWNAQWEESFDPVFVDDRAVIYPPFKPQNESDFELAISIMPRMSFGTGHHPTTAGIIGLMLDTDFKDKVVLDAGAGTAVLAIAASKLGAASVEGYDIDPWSVDNGVDNAERNGVSNVILVEGGEECIKGPYDIILANINRNVLLKQIPVYLASLNQGGILFLSGFYPHDLQILLDKVHEQRTCNVETREQDGWMAAKLTMDV